MAVSSMDEQRRGPLDQRGEGEEDDRDAPAQVPYQTEGVEGLVAVGLLQGTVFIPG